MHDDDRQAFRQAMRGVRRLRSAAPRPSAAPPVPRAFFSRAARHALDERNEAVVSSGSGSASADPASYRRAGVGEAALRRLRRGQYPIEAEIDLHGLRQEQASAQLREFIAEAVGRGIECVRVVHGKGRRSGHAGPVLRPLVDLGLRRIGEVLAFSSARPADGGTGAVYVLLSRRRPTRR